MGGGLVSTCHDNCEECTIPPRGCKLVRVDVQNLMDQGVLQVCGLATNEEVSVIEPCFNLPEPVEIIYQRKDIIRLISYPSPVVVCMPTPFPFKSTNVVPWKYNITVMDGESEDVKSKRILEDVSVDVINITGTSRMTHNGRICTPNFNITPQASTKESTITVPTKDSRLVQSGVKSGEAVEYLKMIKKRNHKIVNHLH